VGRTGFLGLKTLTVIQNAIDQILASGRTLDVAADGTRLYEPDSGTENDIGMIPLDDEKSYELYAKARTVAVFQVESSGMMDALRRMRPTCIEDIVALVALYRPGPMENIPQYCDVKNARAERERLHPSIDHILDETQGIIVYQEQVMQIAQEMAGYSLGGADLLRRAMGKKIQEAMDAERPKFLEGSAKNGVDKKKAMEVWNLLDKFANYGFNKSHAAAYAVVSYQTAWLKANHPVEFMAGVMNCDLHLTEKLDVYANEVRRGLKIEIIPPCVNRSQATFSVGEQKLVYALGALKNVGVEAMRLIVGARGDKPFVNVFDFARRVDLKRVGKRPLEMLARAGAFDQLDPNRRRIFQSLDPLAAYSAAVHEQRASAQVSLFGEAGDDLPEPRLSPVDDWLPNERLVEEQTAIGFYLSGHPLDDYAPALKRKGLITLADLQAKAEAEGAAIARVGVVVSALQERKSGRGTRFFRMNISDPTGQVSGMALFPDDFETMRKVFEQTTQVVMTLEARFNEGQFDPIARSAAPIDGIVDAATAGLNVMIDDEVAVPMVQSVLERFKDDKSIRSRGEIILTALSVPLPGAPQDVSVSIGDGWPVSAQIKGALKSLPGVVLIEDI
jgi:DNA polymerase-3 subunit alpha